MRIDASKEIMIVCMLQSVGYNLAVMYVTIWRFEFLSLKVLKTMRFTLPYVGSLVFVCSNLARML